MHKWCSAPDQGALNLACCSHTVFTRVAWKGRDHVRVCNTEHDRAHGPRALARWSPCTCQHAPSNLRTLLVRSACGSVVGVMQGLSQSPVLWPEASTKNDARMYAMCHVLHVLHAGVLGGRAVP